MCENPRALRRMMCPCDYRRAQRDRDTPQFVEILVGCSVDLQYLLSLHNPALVIEGRRLG